jgi:hypothetical protein
MKSGDGDHRKRRGVRGRIYRRGEVFCVKLIAGCLQECDLRRRLENAVK